MFTDANHYAYSGILTQAIGSPEDVRPIAYTLGLFLDMQQSRSATEKEALTLYQSVLKFDLYLRGAKFILCCNHKLLEPFLSKGIKVAKLNRWFMELADYNIMFVYIKGKNNVLADAISRLKT